MRRYCQNLRKRLPEPWSVIALKLFILSHRCKTLSNKPGFFWRVGMSSMQRESILESLLQSQGFDKYVGFTVSWTNDATAGFVFRRIKFLHWLKLCHLNVVVIKLSSAAFRVYQLTVLVSQPANLLFYALIRLPSEWINFVLPVLKLKPAEWYWHSCGQAPWITDLYNTA